MQFCKNFWRLFEAFEPSFFVVRSASVDVEDFQAQVRSISGTKTEDRKERGPNPLRCREIAGLTESVS